MTQPATEGDGDATFEDYAREWLAAQDWQPSTHRRMRQSLELYVLPQLGDLALADVDQDRVLALVSALRARLSPATVNGAFGVVRAVLRDACRSGAVEAVATEGVVVTRRSAVTRVPVTDEVVQALAGCLPARLRGVPLLAHQLGLRPGEIFALRGEDLDVDRRRLHVQSQLDGHGGVVAVRRQGAARELPVPPELAHELVGRATPGLLFPNRSGTVMNLVDFNNNTWTPALQWAGAVRQLRLMDLRHAHAIWLIGSGLGPKAVSRRLGLSSVQATLRAYGEYFPD